MIDRADASEAVGDFMGTRQIDDDSGRSMAHAARGRFCLLVVPARHNYRFAARGERLSCGESDALRAANDDGCFSTGHFLPQAIDGSVSHSQFHMAIGGFIAFASPRAGRRVSLNEGAANLVGLGESAL